jgi:hypothetical protein
MELLTQLNDHRRKVDFDSFDITVKELISMLKENLIDIAPSYQRQFRWKVDRQSMLIESVYLGIPIPPLFMAANPDGSWEVIDGVQRLSTLIHFCGDDVIRNKIGLGSKLKLSELVKLSAFNNKRYEDLPQSVQIQFLLKPLRVTTISDKSDKDVRFDLFERLNTGGVILTAQEIRSCVYKGNFNELLKDLSRNIAFNEVVKLPKERETDGTKEEFVLRFFAFYDEYLNFQHSVKDFLNNYMKNAAKSFDYSNKVFLFNRVFEYLSNILPQGITRSNRTTTPANLYEAVVVGTALAFHERENLTGGDIITWMHSSELKIMTTGATNSYPKVKGRIEFCRDKLLGR